MSRSRKTRPPSVQARERKERDREGRPVFPRVVERKPRPGDSHPIPARWIRNALRTRIPEEYQLGLTRIELVARKDEVGRPFAWYRPSEKDIQLFSLPMSWRTRRGTLAAESAPYFDARLEALDGGAMQLSWPPGSHRLVWFYVEVLAHELGHHYRHQYRHRRKRTDRLREELLADLHASRFYRREIEVARRRRAKQE